MTGFLGIDTSNYTTSIAFFDSETGSSVQKKKLLPVKNGDLGLRQSDALFHHIAQFPELYRDLRNELPDINITAVGVSSRPRPLDASYMPCFLAGISFSKIIAKTLNVPVCEFSHQEGHIAAALYGAGMLEMLNSRFIAFHVSGGTTEAALITPLDNGLFKTELIASTADLNAGQLVDRVGIMLGLPFPCGKELERLACTCDERFNIRPSLKGFDCCLSGAENLCRKMIDNGDPHEKIASFCIEYIRKTLLCITDRLLEHYGNIPLLFAGGVMSNSIIRKNFEERFGGIFAPPEFSSDNACGIAVLADLYHKSIAR